MTRKFKVTMAPVGQGAQAPQSVHQALKLAEKTGVLPVPSEALCLTVPGGKIEVDHDRK